jgi:hypothetical protein
MVFVTNMVYVTPFVLLPPETGNIDKVGGFISIMMYLGTATCRCNSYSKASVMFIKFAIRMKSCLFYASGFVDWSSTLSP